jgi:hypothetical protein
MRWWADAITEIFDDTTMGDATGGEDVNHVPNCGKELRYPNPHTTTTTLQSSSSLHGGLHNNPTLRSLRRAVHEHQLTHRFLRRMTEARELDLDVVQYDRLKDVAQYGEDTVSNMLYSTLECVGVSFLILVFTSFDGYIVMISLLVFSYLNIILGHLAFIGTR